MNAHWIGNSFKQTPCLAPFYFVHAEWEAVQPARRFSSAGAGTREGPARKGSPTSIC